MSNRIRNPKIAQLVFNTPLIVEPKKGAAILWGLDGRVGDIDSILDHSGAVVPRDHKSNAGSLASSLGVVPDTLRRRFVERGTLPFDVVDGIAIIPVEGTLVHKGKWVGASSGETSYEGISTAVRMAAEDRRIRGIVLEVDSFGGSAQGAFDLVDQIFEARTAKPIWSILTENAASAGYAIASAADRVLMPRTGMAGSIGVVMMHVDFSRMLDEQGITVTIIEAGERKADGNQFEPLGEEVRAAMQQRIDTVWDLFIRTMARNRQTLTAEAIRSMQADTFEGQEALDIGLVDEISAPLAAFQMFVDSFNTRQSGINVVTTPREDDDRSDPDDEGEPIAAVSDTETAQMKVSEPGEAPTLAASSAVTQPTEEDSMSDQTTGSADTPADANSATAAAPVDAEEIRMRERERIQQINALRGKGNEHICDAGIADGSSPGDVAIKIIEFDKARNTQRLEALKAQDTEVPEIHAEPVASVTELGGNKPDAPADPSDEAALKAEFDKSADLQAEFGAFDTYKAFKMAEKDGRFRLLSKAS